MRRAKLIVQLGLHSQSMLQVLQLSTLLQLLLEAGCMCEVAGHALRAWCNCSSYRGRCVFGMYEFLLSWQGYGSPGRSALGLAVRAVAYV